ncbi:hypothetical protein B0H10DRAFT_1779773 [Mycena sp. CBHHK59/15]|nr:hypothetical protein B0H10DRAFT_1779773 [Mycena sp. CBHHK59/15]
MMKKRVGPIMPDTVTGNILLRSGTLIRRYDIAQEALAAIRSGNSSAPSMPRTPIEEAVLSGPSDTVQEGVEVEVDRATLGLTWARVSRETIQVPELPSKADIHTLTSYISYLTATRQPRAVTNILFTVIPKLNSSVYHTNTTRPEDYREGRSARLAILHRAVALGPVFFASMLNALYKSGQPALADRVWQLAKKAERASWESRKSKPWILGCEVYTIMINCYGDLARRQRDWVLKLDPNKRVSRRTSFNSVWAGFLYECQQVPSPLQSHQVQHILHRTMGNAALDVFRRFLDIRRERDQVWHLRRWLAEEDIPKPDARFFNAALRVFRPRAPAKPKPWYEEQVKQAEYMSETYGIHHEWWNAPLQEVAEHMIRAGFPIPFGLQYLFVGRLNNTGPAVQPAHRGTTPYAFPKAIPQGFMRYRLPTPKDRGLPVSRTYPKLLQIKANVRRRREERRR